MSTKAKDSDNKNKMRKILLITGFAITGLQLIASIVLMVIMGAVKIIPKDYVVLLDILLVLFFLIFLIAQRWTVSGIITKVISLIMTIVIIAASVYLNITHGAFKKMTDVTYKTTKVNIYVLKENSVDSVTALQDGTFGIVGGAADRQNTEEAIADIEKNLGKEIKTKEYEDAIALVKALYIREVPAIILNESYVGVVEAEKEYQDFSEKVKTVSSFVKKEEIVTDDKEDNDYFKSDDVLTLYISGVDVNGAPTENRNSDVNIMCVMNFKTHQILLLNTPRDYYVPLSVSNGVPDKLTHAGCIGVDCSVQTLEMLYKTDIDYYFKMNFTGFVNIIDALGGVDVNSDFDFVGYHGKHHYVVGINHLNGAQALGFARERYAFPTGDNQRGKNQMAVINAMINKLVSPELLKNYKNIINAVADSMVTNMTMEEIGKVVDMQLKNGISWDIMQYAVTGKGDSKPGYTYAKPNYVMIPNQETVDKAIGYLEAMHNNQYISVE
jgi:LCP family protein required for cell wall assembly